MKKFIRRRQKHNHITRNLLISLAQLSIDLAASFDRPGAFGLASLKDLSQSLEHLKYSEKQIDRSLTNSQKQNYLKVRGHKIILTKKGAKRAFLSEIKKFQPPQNPWDKKWRIVIFDIPEKRKWARNAFRNKIKELRCFQLQKSVWISPYPIEHYLKFLRWLYELEPYISILKTSHLENEKKLLTYFSFK